MKSSYKNLLFPQYLGRTDNPHTLISVHTNEAFSSVINIIHPLEIGNYSVISTSCKVTTHEDSVPTFSCGKGNNEKRKERSKHQSVISPHIIE
jgi:hypothetical protein